jgi:predicted dehydrogenase
MMPVGGIRCLNDHLPGRTDEMPSPQLPVVQQKTSRRNFLARSAALTSAVAATGLTIPRSVHAAGSEVLKIGLIGCGGRGCGAVASALKVNPHARLTAMADAFSERVQAARKLLQKRAGDQAAVNDDHVFAGLDGYQKLLESGVDVAILAEPPHFRPRHAEACVQAGVHTFLEKPMAVDAPGVRRILRSGQQARERGLSFVSGFETRYSPAAREAVRRVHDGMIGEITSLEMVYNTGFLWHRGREADCTEMEYQVRNWYYFTWLSGDHIVEQHVHLADFTNWVMQEEPPLHAWGYGGRQVRTDPKWGDIFDHHAVVYEYAGGTRLYAMTRQQANTFRTVTKMVQGTQGRLSSGRGGWGTYAIQGATPWEAEKDPGHPELVTFQEMFDGIQAGQPINDAQTMAHSTMLAILGRMATHSGQRITWDEALQSERVLGPASYRWDAEPPVLPGEDGQYPQAIPGQTEVL